MTDQSVEPLAWMREAEEYVATIFGTDGISFKIHRDNLKHMLIEFAAKHAPASPQPATCPHGLILVKWACPICASPQPESAWISKLTLAARTLVTAMETCHICNCLVMVEEGPIRCEDCSYDCEEHEPPDCVSIADLHRVLKQAAAPPAEKGKKP